MTDLVKKEYTIKEFVELAEKITKDSNLLKKELGPVTISLKADGITELVRLIYNEEFKTIHYSFEVDVIPVDAIEIARRIECFIPSAELMQSFYQQEDGNVLTGLDAEIMFEKTTIERQRDHILRQIDIDDKGYMAYVFFATWNPEKLNFVKNIVPRGQA